MKLSVFGLGCVGLVTAVCLAKQAVVLDEVKRGDAKMAQKRIELLSGISILPTIMEVQKLTEKYLKYFNFPGKAERDAYHIAFFKGTPQ